MSFLPSTVWDLWGAKLQCDKFCQIIVAFPYKMTYYQGSVFINLSSRTRTKGPTWPQRINFTPTQGTKPNLPHSCPDCGFCPFILLPVNNGYIVPWNRPRTLCLQSRVGRHWSTMNTFRSSYCVFRNEPLIGCTEWTAVAMVLSALSFALQIHFWRWVKFTLEQATNSQRGWGLDL